MTPGSWHTLETRAVLEALQVDAHSGLSHEEAGRRLVRYGRNELTQEKKASPFDLFFNQFKNILIVILLVATVLSAVVGEYVVAVIILVIHDGPWAALCVSNYV